MNRYPNQPDALDLQIDIPDFRSMPYQPNASTSRVPNSSDVGMNKYSHESYGHERDYVEEQEDEDSSSAGEPEYLQHAKEDWRRFDDFVTIGLLPAISQSSEEVKLTRCRLGTRYSVRTSEEKAGANAWLREIDLLQLDSVTRICWSELLCSSTRRYVLLGSCSIGN